MQLNAAESRVKKQMEAKEWLAKQLELVRLNSRLRCKRSRSAERESKKFL